MAFSSAASSTARANSVIRFVADLGEVLRAAAALLDSQVRAAATRRRDQTVRNYQDSVFPPRPQDRRAPSRFASTTPGGTTASDNSEGPPFTGGPPDAGPPGGGPGTDLNHNPGSPDAGTTTWRPGDAGSIGGQNFVVYDGSVNVDGSRNWRNNNPGNIEAGQFADAHGSIGDDGRFAIYATPEAGMAALVSLLETGRYQQLTIEGAIERFAPPADNNPNNANYVALIESRTGLPASTDMSSLTPTQLESVARAIDGFEGGHPGTTYTAGEASAPGWTAGVLGNGGPSEGGSHP